jgi:hypothetical protein
MMQSEENAIKYNAGIEGHFDKEVMKDIEGHTHIEGRTNAQNLRKS